MTGITVDEWYVPLYAQEALTDWPSGTPDSQFFTWNSAPILNRELEVYYDQENNYQQILAI